MQIIRGRFYMQLTDKVLLPATISYADTGQPSASPRTDRAARATSDYGTEQATEADHSEVCDVTVSAAGDEDRVDEMHDSNACPATVASEDDITGCMEANEPASATDEAGLNTADTAGGLSVMTVSLVNFPSFVGDAAEMSSASLLQPLPLPTAVDIDGTLLHSADSDVVVTDTMAAGDAVQVASCSGEPESTSLTSTLVSNHGDCQEPAEWTRYFMSNSYLLAI